mmetsp:Transcript_8382/g.12165  ORF Transcript_8382/g.12165 Transcript_8382/m.12165 type:complete len:99 (-) Transcript_8382:4-300(-)
MGCHPSYILFITGSIGVFHVSCNACGNNGVVQDGSNGNIVNTADEPIMTPITKGNRNFNVMTAIRVSRFLIETISHRIDKRLIQFASLVSRSLSKLVT